MNDARRRSSRMRCVGCPSASSSQCRPGYSYGELRMGSLKKRSFREESSLTAVAIGKNSIFMRPSGISSARRRAPEWSKVVRRQRSRERGTRPSRAVRNYADERNAHLAHTAVYRCSLRSSVNASGSVNVMSLNLGCNGFNKTLCSPATTAEGTSNASARPLCTNASPTSAEVGSGGEAFHRSGTLSSRSTPPRGSVAPMKTRSLGTSDQSTWTSNSTTASARDVDAYVTCTPREFQRPPRRAAPSPL